MRHSQDDFRRRNTAADFRSVARRLPTFRDLALPYGLTIQPSNASHLVMSRPTPNAFAPSLHVREGRFAI
jgi:hypothetical protein